MHTSKQEKHCKHIKCSRAHRSSTAEPAIAKLKIAKTASKQTGAQASKQVHKQAIKNNANTKYAAEHKKYKPAINCKLSIMKHTMQTQNAAERNYVQASNCKLHAQTSTHNYAAEHKKYKPAIATEHEQTKTHKQAASKQANTKQASKQKQESQQARDCPQAYIQTASIPVTGTEPGVIRTALMEQCGQGQILQK